MGMEKIHRVNAARMELSGSMPIQEKLRMKSCVNWLKMCIRDSYYIEQDGSFLGIKVHKEEVIQYEQRAPVSYTHLDVYKRQARGRPCSGTPPRV